MLDAEFTLSLAELGAILATLYAGPSLLALRYLHNVSKEKDARIKEITEAHERDLARFSELQRAYREDAQKLITRLVGAKEND